MQSLACLSLVTRRMSPSCIITRSNPIGRFESIQRLADVVEIASELDFDAVNQHQDDDEYEDDDAKHDARRARLQMLEERKEKSGHVESDHVGQLAILLVSCVSRVSLPVSRALCAYIADMLELPALPFARVPILRVLYESVATNRDYTTRHFVLRWYIDEIARLKALKRITSDGHEKAHLPSKL